jgi:hypothetical protein
MPVSSPNPIVLFDCGCVLFDLNRLIRFRCFVSSTCTASPAKTSPGDRLHRSFVGEALVDTELRRLAIGGFFVSRRFAVELLFVLGFDNLFGGRRGAGADCSFPMMNESKKYKLTKINSSHLFSIPKNSPEILKRKTIEEGRFRKWEKSKSDDETRRAGLGGSDQGHGRRPGKDWTSYPCGIREGGGFTN